MSEITIPKTHYIGINLSRKSTAEVPLGFLTPGGTDSAAKKRISTVDTWCGKNISKTIWMANDNLADFLKTHPNAVVDQIATDNASSVYSMNSTVVKYINIVDVEYKILDNIPNDPQVGFRITKTISRGGSWNGTSKWVRIEDPRGFELEISVDNLVKVMTMTTFINGVIQEECVWGRQGSSNLLLPVNSEPYQEAVVATARKFSKAVPLKDINIGDTIELKGEHIPIRSGVFCGLYREVFVEQYSPVAKINRSATLLFERKTDKKKYLQGDDSPVFFVAKRYVIMSDMPNEKPMYYGFSNIKVHAVIKKGETMERPVIDATDYQSHSYSQYVSGIPVALTTKIVKPDKIAKTIQYIDIPANKVDLEHRHGLYFTHLEDDTEVMCALPSYRNRNKGLFVAAKIRINPKNNTWACDGYEGEDGGTAFEVIADPSKRVLGLRIKDFTWKQMTITIDDQIIKI